MNVLLTWLFRNRVSCRQLSRLSGVSHETIASLARGRGVAPTSRTLRLLSKATGLTFMRLREAFPRGRLGRPKGAKDKGPRRRAAA